MNPCDRERGEGKEVTVGNRVNDDAVIAWSRMSAKEGWREGDDGGWSGRTGDGDRGEGLGLTGVAYTGDIMPEGEHGSGGWGSGECTIASGKVDIGSGLSMWWWLIGASAAVAGGEYGHNPIN